MNIKELSAKELPQDEQQSLRNVISLIDANRVKEALAIAEKLRPEVQGLLPDSILFKFSQLEEMSMTGGSAFTTPGDGMGIATKNAFGKRKKKKKKSFKLASLLNEISYNKFKNESKTRSKQEQLHKAVKEVKKRVYEIDRLMEYTNRMKNELNEGGDLKYSQFTERAINQISEMVTKLYGNVKKLKK